jgi:hypothetical protein
MKRIFIPIIAFALLALTITSCSDDTTDASNQFNVDPAKIVNSISPTTNGDYNKWLLGNIGQYGYLETQSANDYTAWQFYIICSGGNLQQVNNSRFNWIGTVGNESLTIRSTVDESWNEWKFTSLTYNTSYYIRMARTNDFNEWGIFTNSNQHLFTIKTQKDALWNKWEIDGEVPESHNMNLVGLFFIPVLYATTQPVIN